MVEQEAVNFEVAGSSPVPGAMNKKMTFRSYFYSLLSGGWMRTEGSTGRRSERISEACLRYSERGGTEGFCFSKILIQSRSLCIFIGFD